MNKKVLSKYRLITVGECPGVNAEQAKKYANIDGSELDMIFQFEHVSASPSIPTHYGKWDALPMTMPELRENFTKWQNALEGCAWNSRDLETIVPNIVSYQLRCWQQLFIFKKAHRISIRVRNLA